MGEIRFASYSYTDDKRKTVAKEIVRCKGNILKAAFFIGIHRSHMYRLIDEYRLWPLINQVRRNEVKERYRKKKVIGGVYV
jgi:hypothetical protein